MPCVSQTDASARAAPYAEPAEAKDERMFACGADNTVLTHRAAGWFTVLLL